MQKSSIFLNNSHEYNMNILNIIPLIYLLPFEKITYLNINLTKYVQDLYAEFI